MPHSDTTNWCYLDTFRHTTFFFSVTYKAGGGKTGRTRGNRHVTRYRIGLPATEVRQVRHCGGAATRGAVIGAVTGGSDVGSRWQHNTGPRPIPVSSSTESVARGDRRRAPVEVAIETERDEVDFLCDVHRQAQPPSMVSTDLLTKHAWRCPKRGNFRSLIRRADQHRNTSPLRHLMRRKLDDLHALVARKGIDLAFAFGCPPRRLVAR